MVRVVCVTAALLLSAVVILPAQPQDRERTFGLSQDAWCREARGADFCEVREETLTNRNVVDIDARGNGGVSVRGWDRDEVHVRVRVTAQARNEADARSLARETRLTTSDRIRMEGPRYADRGWRDWDRRHDREWWSAAFELQVPRNARLTIDATNGGIVVEGMRGSVDADTTNGGLRFYDVSGDVRGRTTNGGVNVELTGERWQGAGLDVRTTNGGVRLWVPSNFSAELDARATNGGIGVDFPITVQGLLNTRRELRATIGSGGPPIRVATINGGVRIEHR